MTGTGNDGSPGVRQPSSRDRRHGVRFTEITDKTEVIGPEIGKLRSRVDGGRGPAKDRDAASPADQRELLAPFALGVTYVGVAGVFGTTVFDTGASGFGAIVAFALLGTLLFLSAWSTARLVDDANWREERAAAWTPNPYHYLVGGALVLLAIGMVRLVLHGRLDEVTGVAALGRVVVALVLSSIVAGPIYLVQCWRKAESE